MASDISAGLIEGDGWKLRKYKIMGENIIRIDQGAKAKMFKESTFIEAMNKLSSEY